MKKLILIVIVIIGISSCITTRNSNYLTNMVYSNHIPKQGHKQKDYKQSSKKKAIKKYEKICRND